MLTSTRDDRVFAYGGRDGRDTLVEQRCNDQKRGCSFGGGCQAGAGLYLLPKCQFSISRSRVLTPTCHKYFIICEMRTDSHCELVTRLRQDVHHDTSCILRKVHRGRVSARSLSFTAQISTGISTPNRLRNVEKHDVMIRTRPMPSGNSEKD